MSDLESYSPNLPLKYSMDEVVGVRGREGKVVHGMFDE